MRGLGSREWARVSIVLLLALGLRLIALDSRTLWYDEAFAVLFAEQGWDAMREGTLTAVEGGAADVHPLLYYQCLNLWMRAFGDSPAAVRLFSVLLGVLTVGAIYLLAREWFGVRTGIVAAAITAVAPFHVQYSQEVRMYALLGLTLTVATWLYWRAWQQGSSGYWVAFGMVAGVSMYVQQLAGVTLMAIGLIPLWLRDRARMWRTVLAAILAGVIYLPWMWHLPAQLGKLRQYWIQKPSVFAPWLALRSFTSVNLDFAAGWWLPTFMVAALLTVMLLLRGWATLRAPRTMPQERLALTWALWLAFGPMLLMWGISYVFQPIFLPRALLPSALILYVALAWLFTRAGLPGPIVGVLAIAWAMVIGFGLYTHYSWNTFPNGPFDQAAAYLRAEAGAGDVIVHGNKLTFLPMVYYDRRLPQHYVRDIPGSESDTLAVPTQRALKLLADRCVAAAAQGAPRVWYVAFDRLEDEMIALASKNPDDQRYDALAWLRLHYAEVSVRNFNDLDVYLFEGPDSIARRAQCEAD